MRKILFILSLIFIATNLSAAIWYVKLDASSTAWDTKTPTQVKSTILEAFNAAIANDEIWVSAGVAKIDASIAFNKHLKVYGSFIGTENSIAERAKVTDGKPWEFVNQTYVEPNTDIRTSFMTVPSGQNVIINGFNFRNFNITTANQAVCNIRQNTIIEQCVFDSNTSTNDGAAIRIYPGGHVKDSYFYKNKANTSTAIFVNVLNQPTSVIGCTIEANEGQWGAALNLKNSSGHGLGFSFIIKDNIIINNKATASGINSIVTIRWQECVVSNMLIANNEGVPLHIENGTFTNGTIVNNRVKDGTVLIDAVQAADNPSKLQNTVIWNNKTATDEILGIKVNSASASILLKNNASDVATDNTPGQITEQNFILLESVNTGTEADKNYPVFLTPSPFVGISATDEGAIRNADWRIDQGSALINAGDDALVHGSVEKDLAGINRFFGTVDIGAYEFDNTATSNNRILDNAGTVYYANGTLFLDNIASNLPLTVYTISGAAIAQTRTAATVLLPLNKGVYIVKTDAKNYKIFVR